MENTQYNLDSIPHKESTPCCWNCEKSMRKLMKKSLNIPSFVVCDNRYSEFYGKEMKPNDGCKMMKKRGILE